MISFNVGTIYLSEIPINEINKCFESNSHETSDNDRRLGQQLGARCIAFSLFVLMLRIATIYNLLSISGYASLKDCTFATVLLKYVIFTSIFDNVFIFSVLSLIAPIEKKIIKNFVGLCLCVFFLSINLT